MRIRFDSAALENHDDWRFLRKIIELIDDEWHEWHVVDADIIESTPWFQQLDHSHRLLFEKATQATARFHNDENESDELQLHVKILAVGEHRPPQSLPPDSALDYLKLPLKILLENRVTDRMFVRAILTRLAQPDILHLVKIGAIIYDSDGGNGNIKNLLKILRAECDVPGMPLRAVVITDSDARMPNKKAGKTPKELKEFCDQRGIPCFVLKKRSIENYVPDEVILDWGSDNGRQNLKPHIEALRGMNNDEARDYFPMKEAIKPASKDATDIEEASWYQTELDPGDFELLCRPKFKGFGEHFINILFLEETNGFKKPRESLTAQALQRRDGCGELDDVVRTIERLV